MTTKVGGLVREKTHVQKSLIVIGWQEEGSEEENQVGTIKKRTCLQRTSVSKNTKLTSDAPPPCDVTP